MQGATLARLQRCLKDHKSFRIGRRGADWFFYSFKAEGKNIDGWTKAVNRRARTTITNIDWIGIEKGHLMLYAEGGYVLTTCICLDDYTTCEILHPEDEEDIVDAKMEAIKRTAWGQEASE